MKAKSLPASGSAAGWNSRSIYQFLSSLSSMRTLLRQGASAGWMPSTISWRLRPSKGCGGSSCEVQDGPGDVHAGDELGNLLGGEVRPPHDEGYLHGLLVGMALFTYLCSPAWTPLSEVKMTSRF